MTITEVIPSVVVVGRGLIDRVKTEAMKVEERKKKGKKNPMFFFREGKKINESEGKKIPKLIKKKIIPAITVRNIIQTKFRVIFNIVFFFFLLTSSSLFFFSIFSKKKKGCHWC